MSRLKYRSFMLLFIVIWVNSIAAIPTPLANQTSNQAKEARLRPKFVEIKLPVKIASMDDLFAWMKKAMRSMASKIDITLAGDKSDGNDTAKSGREVKIGEIKPMMMNKVEMKEQSALPRNAIVGSDREELNSWSKTGNEIFPSLLNAEAFLPLFFGNNYAHKFSADDYAKYTYNSVVPGDMGDKISSTVAPDDEKTVKFNSRGVISQSLKTGNGQNVNGSDPLESSTEPRVSSRIINSSGNPPPGPVPFSIPFQAFITITREPHEPESSKIQVNTTSVANNPPNISSLVVPIQTPVFQQFRSDCNHSRPYFEAGSYNSKVQGDFDNHRPGNFERKPYKVNDFHDFGDYSTANDERSRPNPGDDKRQGIELPKRNNSKKNRDSSSKRQLTTLGDILKSLGLIRKSTKGTRLQEAATTSSGMKRPRDNPPRRPTFQFEDELPHRPTRNETYQRQEFDDDSDEDEKPGSLGSVADLLPLALPILEGLSDPESEDDIIEVIQAAIPILQGLSEGDDDEGEGGVNDLIARIVPVIIKIINGRDGQGIDLAALFGPIFSLLAPFIGPVLAPIIGPLIRTISNPPTEGSSLGALITAIAGPLSAPQEPSGMSPLSIVIAGTTAALLRELKPGTPGGSDLGALVGSILSGVLAGTSAGLSGGSSGGADSGATHAPYAASPVSSSTVNVGFPGRPSPGPFIDRPSHTENTVHIGSTVSPTYSSIRPTYPYPHHQATVATPHRVSSPRPHVQYHSGPVTAAAGEYGGSSYLPMGTAVPAASVNPLALLGSSVKEIVGAGIQVVSSVINAVFGIIGASSAEQPSPTYGTPTGYGHASG